LARKINIHKAGGIIIRDRKVLLGRSKGKSLFINPGGKLEQGETVKQALVCELMEEFRIGVSEADLEEFGTFYAPAAGQEDSWLRMDVLIVTKWEGDPVVDHEIEELRWASSELEPGLKTGSIFEHEVIPRLKAQGLID